MKTERLSFKVTFKDKKDTERKEKIAKLCIYCKNYNCNRLKNALTEERPLNSK